MKMRRPRGKKDDEVFLEHILIAIDEIAEHTKNDERDLKTERAVERLIEIIGEASRRLSEEIKSEFSSVPWHKIIGMRNFVSHGYFATDQDTVWDTVEEEIPELRKIISSMLEKIKKNKKS